MFHDITCLIVIVIDGMDSFLWKMKHPLYGLSYSGEQNAQGHNYPLRELTLRDFVTYIAEFRYCMLYSQYYTYSFVRFIKESR